MNITPAKTEFKKNGYLYKQIDRAGDIAIYCQNTRRGSDWVPYAYEVVVLRVNAARPNIGIPAPSERYPSAEDWGYYGWTFWDLEPAREKYRALLRSRDILT
jgi:hypothetical protein